ncbi:MAG: 1-acyl-sn-glycerol-3-phosphate acyltransferase [Blastocatellia bacterium]|jgi:1-acyl-sn-glycerol-3-phosphate acyltransferase|nr:1-acyl-sn-glycerol-3-phosphate acyltransferase [Blastocatellia bacterium]
MSESTKTTSEPVVLPQWLLDTLRPAAGALCNLMWNIRYRGKEHIPASGGLLVAANHQTYMDPLWIALPIKRPLRFLAWDAAFSWPIVGPAMGFFGAWPLQIEGNDRAPIRKSLQWLRQGGGVVIFPEGGRGKPDGSMIKFKAGAVRMAIEASVPILPVTIRGAHRVWPPNKRLPRPGDVDIIYHEPLRIALPAGDDFRSCVQRENERLATIIRSAL